MVRRGGVAAIEAVLSDAVDVLERKLQLLAEKGWFEDLERRRSALDRLLPTIRAAADPITRELYLSRVAERTGVAKDVLERELRSGVARGAPSRQASPPATIGRVAAPSRGAGWDLLRVLLVAPSFRERARESIRPEAFEVPEQRELFAALVSEGTAGDQPPPGLSAAAQLQWSRLREAADELEGANLDEMFATTSEMVISAPEWQVIQAIADPLERRRRVDEFKLRYPSAGRARDFQRRARKRT
jgi:DNA primase